MLFDYRLAGLFLVAGAGAWMGCAGQTASLEHPEGEVAGKSSHASGPVHIELPADSTAARDDRTAPVLQVSTAGGTVFPTVYGYPIYPEGDGAQGITMFRRDNKTGMRKRETTDDAGVVHEIEEYPQLGCRFDGVRENVNKFVPLSLTCDLPPPKPVGGVKRPVMGELTSGAKAEQLLQDKTVEQVFLGEFHLKTEDFEAGSGTGYFNTTHGQLAFGFSKKKLARVVYYFDPAVKGWQNPNLWVTP